MSATNADDVPAVEGRGFTPIDELIRQMGRSPMTFEQWATSAPDVFESDEELDEFLLWYRAERQRNLG
ncbi:hypothetical protein QLQ12_31715 [Actinoplanes sp. NEAU-A12]|uniref:Uncharacterized protein n=1 Tax=Actinoplanes sandaracinus TaxID=3045177 RepID=A0ABT6WTZ9_9ACTN|nr:hypothetical protein [Actinoplanes sandaracinus]MDI6103185.1 hypothetical protein [Actinoplanes sandaracinus]